MLKATQAYLKTLVNTTTQGDLLIMLYDGAIKFLGQAKEKMAEKDYAQKGILITKAINVISELDESLNGQKGGELAQNLHKLYFYCNTRLLKANLEMNTALIDEVLRILGSLRGAFDQINGSMEQNPAGMSLASGPEPVPLAQENKVQEPKTPPKKAQAPENEAENAAKTRPTAIGAYKKILAYHRTP